MVTTNAMLVVIFFIKSKQTTKKNKHKITAFDH